MKKSIIYASFLMNFIIFAALGVWIYQDSQATRPDVTARLVKQQEARHRFVKEALSFVGRDISSNATYEIGRMYDNFGSNSEMPREICPGLYQIGATNAQSQ